MSNQIVGPIHLSKSPQSTRPSLRNRYPQVDWLIVAWKPTNLTNFHYQISPFFLGTSLFWVKYWVDLARSSWDLDRSSQFQPNLSSSTPIDNWLLPEKTWLARFDPSFWLVAGPDLGNSKWSSLVRVGYKPDPNWLVDNLSSMCWLFEWFGKG